MIHFPAIRLSRFSAQLRELSIGNSIALAGREKSQEGTRFLVEKSLESLSGEVTDIDRMTVQERLFVMAHYLAFISDDGPNFKLGDGTYADYFDGEHDYTKSSVELGELEGDPWELTHLLSGSLDALERIEGMVDGVSGAHFWNLGAMACQLVRKGETIPGAFNADYDDWLANRIKIFNAFPEGDFLALLSLYEQGLDDLNHLFRIGFDDEGLLVWPKEVDSALSPARFRARTAVSKYAQAMAGRLDE